MSEPDWTVLHSCTFASLSRNRGKKILICKKKKKRDDKRIYGSIKVKNKISSQMLTLGKKEIDNWWTNTSSYHQQDLYDVITVLLCLHLEKCRWRHQSFPNDRQRRTDITCYYNSPATKALNLNSADKYAIVYMCIIYRWLP